jgi:urea transporter
MVDAFGRQPAYLATIGAGVVVSVAVDTAVAHILRERSWATSRRSLARTT